MICNWNNTTEEISLVVHDTEGLAVVQVIFPSSDNFDDRVDGRLVWDRASDH